VLRQDNGTRQYSTDYRGLHKFAPGNATFEVGDCRDIELGDRFDGAICLYDVIGTYATDADNLAILQNLARQVKLGGHILLSVMNMELTVRKARYRFSMTPDKLLMLKASNTMQSSGNIFNP